MKKVYEKECEVCGAYFTTEYKTQKYCDKHKKNGARSTRVVEKQIEKIGRLYGQPRLKTYKCEYCGREHSAPNRLLTKLCISPASSWDGERHYYCCTEHVDADRHDHSTCSNCGKSLKGCDYGYSPYREFNFCSEECEKEHELRRYRSNGWVHTCERCGKEFVRKTEKAYFCSNECYRAAKKDGWESQDTIERNRLRDVEAKKIYSITCTCDFCKKSYTVTRKSKTSAIEYQSASLHFCSPNCSKSYWINVKEAEEIEKSIEDRLELKKKSSKKTSTEPLCTTCKVSYKDCERMQSNFTILPEGAHYNSNGVLCECPKYRG